MPSDEGLKVIDVFLKGGRSGAEDVGKVERKAMILPPHTPVTKGEVSLEHDDNLNITRPIERPVNIGMKAHVKKIKAAKQAETIKMKDTAKQDAAGLFRETEPVASRKIHSKISVVKEKDGPVNYPALFAQGSSPGETKGHGADVKYTETLPVQYKAGVDGITAKRDRQARRFREMVFGRIEMTKIYPEIARKRGIEGSVLVRFIILPDGNVSDIAMVSQTNAHRILIKAALDTIRRAAPYLPVPSYLRREGGMRFEVRISYRLD